jgi:hypothetical protein
MIDYLDMPKFTLTEDVIAVLTCLLLLLPAILFICLYWFSFGVTRGPEGEVSGRLNV